MASSPRSAGAAPAAALMAGLLLATGAPCAFASAAEVASATADEQRLRALNAEWLDAYRTGEGAALERILAPEFITTMPSGARRTRAEVIRDATAPGGQVAAISWDQLEVRVFGGAAVVTGRATFTTTAADGPVTRRTLYTDVYVRRGGDWVAVAAHVSRAAP